MNPEFEFTLQKIANGVKSDMIIPGSGQNRSKQTAPQYQVSEQRVDPWQASRAGSLR
jgi:hypothetical protein